MNNILKDLKDIENSFITELRNNNIELSDNADCDISENCITIYLKSSQEGRRIFSSNIELYSGKPETYIFGKRENSINFGSSGSFDPTNEASYWRTIHAASILKNWEVVSNIVNKHCEMYIELGKD
jgi:hypothetical protein